MYRSLATVLMLLLVSTGSAFAKNGSGPSTHTRTLKLSGTGNPAPAEDLGPHGECNIGFASQCLSGNCACFEIENASGSGSMNKGAQTVSNFFVTVDQDFNPATEPPVDDGPGASCNPFFAVVTVASATESKTLNLMGVSCKHVIAVNKNNPGGTHDKDLLSGGWGISNSPAPNPDASGWGTLAGQVSNPKSASPKISMKLTGTVTE